MTKEEAKRKIFDLIAKAENLTPSSFEVDLPPLDGFPDVPDWHDYEREIWKLGERIRQIMTEHKSLRKDTSITDKVVSFCQNKNAKRGREPFVMLLWYKHNQKYAKELIHLIRDDYVYGHVIEGLNKMQVAGFEKEVAPFVNTKVTWIRKQAEKYMKRYGYSDQEK